MKSYVKQTIKDIGLKIELKVNQRTRAKQLRKANTQLDILSPGWKKEVNIDRHTNFEEEIKRKKI